MSATQRLVVVGQGYVGLPLAMRAVAAGYDVTGLEASIDRVKRLAAGESFVEDVSSAELQAALDSGRYRVTDSPAACDGFDVAVDHRADSAARGRARPVATSSRPPRRWPRSSGRASLVVLESTTYPGTTESLFVPLLEAGSGLRAGADFAVGYSPERIDPGNPTWNLQTTPKIVSGVDAASTERTDAFYRTVVDRR